jgi:hypothetical protein
MRRRTAAWRRRTRRVDWKPAPPGLMESRERVHWRMCWVVSRWCVRTCVVEVVEAEAR